MKIKNSAGWGVLVLAVIIGVAGARSVPVSAQPAGNQPAGVWLIEGTPEPASGLQPFVNLATLTADGQMVNVDPGVGTSIGGWTRIAGRLYAVTFTGFAPGGLRYVVTATVSLDHTGHHLAGPYRTQFLDSSGAHVFSYVGTVSAKRQIVQQY